MIDQSIIADTVEGAWTTAYRRCFRAGEKGCYYSRDEANDVLQRQRNSATVRGSRPIACTIALFNVDRWCSYDPRSCLVGRYALAVSRQESRQKRIFFKRELFASSSHLFYLFLLLLSPLLLSPPVPATIRMVNCRWSIDVILSIASSASNLIVFAPACYLACPNQSDDSCFQRSQPPRRSSHVENSNSEYSIHAWYSTGWCVVVSIWTKHMNIICCHDVLVEKVSALDGKYSACGCSHHVVRWSLTTLLFVPSDLSDLSELAFDTIF
jgi:hypothetical protein